MIVVLCIVVTAYLVFLHPALVRSGRVLHFDVLMVVRPVLYKFFNVCALIRSIPMIRFQLSYPRHTAIPLRRINFIFAESAHAVPLYQNAMKHI